MAAKSKEPDIYFEIASIMENILQAAEREVFPQVLKALPAAQNSKKLENAAILQQNGHVHTKWYHFDAKGHCFWAKYLLQYIKQNNLVTTDALPTD